MMTGFSGGSVDNAAVLQILPPIVPPSSRDVPPPTDQNCAYITLNITSYSPEDPTPKSVTKDNNFTNK